MSAWDAAPLVVGHRGGRGQGWPRENTVEAFERARAEGATAIELDVRTVAGQVVVLHDRPEGDVAGGFTPPRLGDVLSWARERGVAVNVEMKHDVADRRALAHATCRLVLGSRADVLLSSFDPLLLALAAVAAPRVPRALLVHARQRAWADALQALVRPPAVQAVHLERTQTRPRTVEGLRARGLRVGAWTVNDPREAVDLAALGVATLITDQPAAIRAALALAGAGPPAGAPR